MKMFALSLILLLGLVSGVAQAGAARCEGCSESQFKAKAKMLGLGQHVISSFSTNQIKIYNVRMESSGGEPGVPDIRLAIPVAVPADIKALFDEVHHFYVQNGSSLRAVVLVDGEDLGVSGMQGATAYDVMTDVNLRGRLGDRLIQPFKGIDQLDYAGEKLLQGLYGFIGAADASIEVTVEMSDGSIVVYQLANGTYTGKYLEGRSRTENGQVIPEGNSPESQGTWTGDGDIRDLKEYLEGLGARFTQIGTGTIMQTMTCSWAPPTLTCKITVTRQ